MLTDIEIAQQAQLKRIEAIATDNNVDPEILEQYGKYKAKVDFVPNQLQISQGKLILVTATTPNKSGSGKTTTSVALAQGLNHIGKKAIVALRWRRLESEGLLSDSLTTGSIQDLVIIAFVICSK